MTKQELIKEWSAKSGEPQTQLAPLLDSLGEVVQEALLVDGAKVPVLGVTLKSKVKAGRTGINPRTQEPLEIPARLTVSMTKSKGFNDMLKAVEV